jgi:DNA-binding NarL/FixJ family response regulator
MASTDGVYDLAAQHWATALQTYRQSIDLYRHVLQLRVRRFERLSLPRSAPPKLVAEPAPIPISREPSGSLTALTAREQEVAQLMAYGFTNQQIAEKLIVTRGTVANHVAHILDKLGLANRTQVAAYLIAGRASGPGASAVANTWIEDAVREVG